MLERGGGGRPRSRSTAIQSERTRRRSPRAFTSPASWIAPPNSSNFSVKVVLPASGCEMIARCAGAQSRREGYSSIRFNYCRDMGRRWQAVLLRQHWRWI
jgi:hypothetical protein